MLFLKVQSQLFVFLWLQTPQAHGTHCSAVVLSASSINGRPQAAPTSNRMFEAPQCNRRPQTRPDLKVELL